jgi:hypothetical protein
LIHFFIGVSHGEGKQRKEAKMRYLQGVPKWDWVDYKLQDAQFLKEVNKLSIKRLDPKHDVTNEQITTMDIAKVFNTINPFLPLVAKKEIKHCTGRLMGLPTLQIMS